MDLRNESRWEFLNTLFSVSEAVAYMQVTSFLIIGLFFYLWVDCNFHIYVEVIVMIYARGFQGILSISFSVCCLY